MTGYEDWSVAGWRTHLPGVADVRAVAASLGEETIPALAAAAAERVPGRVAVTVDGEPVTHAELDDEAGRVAAWLAQRVRPGDRVLLAAGAGLGFVRCYLGALRAGAVVPTIYQALLEAPAALAGGLAGLRLAVCGSAPLSPALAGRVPAVLGRLPLVRYGTTESGLNVSNPLGGARGDTIGVPLPGALARIRAADALADPGEDGEIQLRGPHVFSGYWNDPAATSAAFTPDGWFRTGDIGAVDPATGHLAIRGRTKEMIITGSLNVYPREVEIALEGHPSVAEAAVAGVADERWGERVTAWVVLRDGHGLDEAALIAHARTRLAGYKCPKRIFQLAELPRNQLGKVVRSGLRERG